MPYPNEHACRVNDPKKYERLRRSNGAFAPGIDVIYGVRDTAEGEETEVQAIRFAADKFTEAEARDWCKAQNFKCIEFEVAKPQRDDNAKKDDAGETADLIGEEIFAAGEWTSNQGKKRKYTERDLVDMAAAAHALGDNLRIPIKLGHNDQQLALFVDGMPAAGWVKNLRADGAKLVADLCDIPKKIYDLVKNGAYATKSAELWHDYKDEATGQKFKNVVCGLALLGAELPALSNLNALANLYSRYSKWSKNPSLQSATAFYIRDDESGQGDSDNNRNDVVDDQQHQHQKEGDEQMEEKIAELEAKLAEAMAENETLKAEIAAAQTEMAAMKDADKSAADNAAADGGDAGITAAQMEAHVAEAVTEAVGKIEMSKNAEIASLKNRLDAMADAEDAAFLDQHSAKFAPVLRPHFAAMFRAARSAENNGKKDSFSMKISETEEIKSANDLRDHIAGLPENHLMSEFGKSELDRKRGGDIEKKRQAYCKENQLDYNTTEGYRRAALAVPEVN